MNDDVMYIGLAVIGICSAFILFMGWCLCRISAQSDQSIQLMQRRQSEVDFQQPKG